MRAFLTGATGFVGGHLVDQLLAGGHHVTALVRTPSKGAALAERGVTLVQGDLRDLRALREGAADADVVYHLAALTGAVNEAEFLTANREGTANALNAAMASPRRPRLVYVSSMAAGGPSRRAAPAGHPAPAEHARHARADRAAPARAGAGRARAAPRGGARAR